MFGGNYFAQQIFAGGTPYTPQSLDQTFTETLSVVQVYNFSLTRSLLESVTLTDAFASLVVFFKNLSEAISVTDTLTKIGTFVRSLTETLPVTDVLLRSTAKTFDEVVTIVQSFVKTMTRSFTEVVTIVSGFASQLAKLFTEVVVIADNLLVSFAKMFIETITLNEVFAKVATFARAVVLLATLILKPLTTALNIKPRVSSKQVGS